MLMLNSIVYGCGHGLAGWEEVASLMTAVQDKRDLVTTSYTEG